MMSAFILCLLSMAAESRAQTLFPDVSGNSRPLDTQPNVPVDKGRRGLLYHFNCVDGGGNPTNACFPLGHYDNTGAFVSLGPVAVVTVSAAANPCSVGSTPAANACSYVVLDAFGRGNTCVSPVAPHPSNYPCADTVEIFYNGSFSNGASIQETVTQALGNEAGSSVTQVSCGSSSCTLTFQTSNSTTPPPVSIGLVFDISGSMGWPAVPSGAVTRMKVLKDSAQTFFGTLNSFAISGDKLGLSTFSTTATPDPSSCSGTSLKAANAGNVNSIATQVAALGPTNSTSIGAGLISANSCGFAADMAGNQNKEILLFSDGEQNTPPLVGFSGSQIQVSDISGTSFSNYPASNNPTDIHICPVTAGRLTAAGFHLQQQIADAACHSLNAHIRDSDQTLATADLETFFAQSLSIILPTDKMELVSDTTGTVARGATAIEKYLGNASDAKTMIALSWSGVIFEGGEDSLVLRLRSPDGSLVDLTGRTTFASNHSFTVIPLPLFRRGLPVGQKGIWQIELDGSKLFSQQVTYHLQALNSQGNFLSTTSATIVSNPGDPASTKGQAKLDALLANAANVGLFADQSLPTLSLSDNGNSSNGDTTANDGIYSGLFKDTTKEGHYYFSVRILGTSAKAGDFQRAYRVTEFVRSKPDPNQTNLQVISSVAQPNGTVLVTLGATPHDSFGNFLGPGYEKDMQITSSMGSVQTPLDDKLNGSYQITYSLPSVGSDPNISVVILGQPVLSVPLHAIPGGGPGPGPGGNKWAVSFHLGVTIPHGSLSAFSPSVSLGGDLEYRLPHGVSLETYVGFDHFRSGLGDTHFVNLSERGKVTFGSGTLRPFAFFGVGGYFASGGNNYAGVNTGVGLQYWLKHRFAIEGTYTFHNVFVTGGNARYSTLLGSVRYVFK